MKENVDMKENYDAVDMAIEVLNRAIENDYDAMLKFVNTRIPCNAKMLDDPTIQVGNYRECDPSFGIIGLINGLFGSKENSHGKIRLQCNVDKDNDYRITEIYRFERND